MIDRIRAALSDRYRIERELGAGGMATVYLADDLKHQRQVAIKVLRSELAAVVGAERFLAEIETTANLQHPHILPLFDSGEDDGLLWYAMPYVAGESLRERIERERQLPVDEAVRIACDVAEALHAAHERGVIHRDIKPANILMSGGRPLVADFGIALAVSNAGGGRLTETGLSLGTPYYMSPEQASADRDPTPQSDQYSLACVLYEMLVGEPPYPGGSAQAVLARILTGEPTPPSQVRRSVPPHVDAVVMRGLEKLPADRFPDTREMVRALRDEGHRYVTSAPAPGRAASRGVRGAVLLPWAIAAVLAVVAGVAWLRPTPRSGGVGSIRVAIPIDSATPIPLGNLVSLGSDREVFDVAPDGTTIVYVGWDGEGTGLYLRPLDRFETTALAGTEGATDPFFSPDGRWIGYFAEGGLWKVPTAGGEPLRLASAANPSGGTWGEAGRIWYSVNEGSVLMSIGSSGEDPRLEAGGGYGTPRLLPDGAGILSTANWPTEVWLRWGEEEEQRVLLPGRQPQFHPAGYLTFVQGRTLYAAGFDVARGELTTSPVPVLEGIRAQGWAAGYRLGRDGTLFYLPGANADLGVPVLVTPGGGTDTLSLPRGEYGHLAISPDLGRIATFEISGDFELLVHDLSSQREQLLQRGGFIQQAIWSRRGDRIAYTRAAGRDAPWEIVVRTPDSTDERVLHSSPDPLLVSDWAPGDTTVIFTRWNPTSGGEIYTVDPRGGREAETLVVRPSTDWGGVVSPDGRWMAYTSDRAGSYGIYLTPYPNPGESGSVRVSVHENAEESHWSPEGDAILYRADGRWWRVPLGFEPAPVPGTPEFILEGSYINVPGKSWDLLPDGRLLLFDGPHDETVDRIHMIPGFLSEIEARIAEAGR